MDTLHDRLAALAEDAPTGGASPAELWTRGRRAGRIRAAALAATVIVVGAVGTGIGLRLDDRDGAGAKLEWAGTVGIALPITYPAGEQPAELPDLESTPGPLAAIWVAPRVHGGELEAVGLVAGTGAFGVLPVDAYYAGYQGGDLGIALSPDGRRIAYATREGGLTVRDLVSGEQETPAFDGFESRGGFSWVENTLLAGHVAGGTDADGWVWEPGTAPRRVDLYVELGSGWLGSQAGIDPWFLLQDEDGPCSSPTVHESGRAVLCDALGVIGPEIVLTHWNDEVVALDRSDSPFQDTPRRPVVVAAGAPERVVFATSLIGSLFDDDAGAP